MKTREDSKSAAGNISGYLFLVVFGALAIWLIIDTAIDTIHRLT